MGNRLDRPRVHGYDRLTMIVRGDVLPPGFTPALLPREQDRHTVMVAAEPELDVAALTALLRRHLPVRCTSIRLVLSESGRAGVAPVIAGELGVEVIAPAGPVVLLPSGMVFVVDGQWWRFRPGEPGERQGPRHPAPPWERLLPLTLHALPDGVVATTVPAGLWLYEAASPASSLPTEVLSAPVDPARLSVMLGRPGRELAQATVYSVLESLPRALRRRMILTPYGSGETTEANPPRLGRPGLYTGAVFSGWHLAQPPHWRTGEEVSAPAALTATTAPEPPLSGDPVPAGPEVVIWSVNGLREAGWGSERVRFAPGTRMRVVDVAHRGRDDAALVLLREVAPDAGAGTAHTAASVPAAVLDRQARTALRRAVGAVRRSPGAGAWPAPAT
ncbi:hypothetical protein [Paractinoplanes hotanensis]|uniref:Uncharacterized protein n=1 Tax=Paractinoplanes hotanensis TaxID=2906497 RepID=A0ABT0YBP1_9ACTN|nr:hypothetical protein [Actinoplanes hotanensis]MCM4083459.1 hypothetical protein [Actinoplanes hotanensis]